MAAAGESADGGAAAAGKKVVEDAILGFLQSNDEISDSHKFAVSTGVDHTELENVIKSLHGFQIVFAKVFYSLFRFV